MKILTAVIDHLFQALTALCGRSSTEESCRHLCLPETRLNPLALEKGGTPGTISLPSVLLRTNTISVGSFCLLISMALILIPTCRLLHLHSKDKSRLKIVIMKI